VKEVFYGLVPARAWSPAVVDDKYKQSVSRQPFSFHIIHEVADCVIKLRDGCVVGNVMLRQLRVVSVEIEMFFWRIVRLMRQVGRIPNKERLAVRLAIDKIINRLIGLASFIY